MKNLKHLFLFVCLTILSQTDIFSQTKIELTNYQSMSITGKGPGQDAVINPFKDEDCYAVVENIGQNEFSIRIQKEGKILDTFLLPKKEKKKFKLLKGQELYFDSESKNTAKASVDFAKLEE